MSQSILGLTGYSTAVTFILNKHILVRSVERRRNEAGCSVCQISRWPHWISSLQHSTIHSTGTNTAISCSAWLEHGAFVLAAKSGTSPSPSRRRGRAGGWGRHHHPQHHCYHHGHHHASVPVSSQSLCSLITAAPSSEPRRGQDPIYPTRELEPCPSLDTRGGCAARRWAALVLAIA